MDCDVLSPMPLPLNIPKIIFNVTTFALSLDIFWAITWGILSHSMALVLRVVFPLTEPRKPSGRKSPKNGKKLQNSPPRSNPRKWGKITEKLQKMYFRSIFCNFSVIFPHFRGLDRGGGFCNFFPFFGDSRPGGFRGSVRGKTTRNACKL